MMEAMYIRYTYRGRDNGLIWMLFDIIEIFKWNELK